MKPCPVLVVEDDDDLRRLLGMVCDMHGINAICVPDTASALRVLEEGSVGMVLTDLHLGGDHDGLRVLDAAVARDRPVAVLSASVQVDKSELVALGASRVLAKPFDVFSLPALIAEVCPDCGSLS